jgi:hypothetical protein
MKFLISYECRNGEDALLGEFEYESEYKPVEADLLVIEAAIKDSRRLHKSGLASVRIVSIVTFTKTN